MEETARRQRNIWALLALIFGCVTLMCILYILYAFFLSWSEWSRLAVALTTILFGTLLLVGPLASLLSILFGTFALIRAQRQGIGSPHRHAVFARVAIAVGLLYWGVFLLLFLLG